MDEDEVEFEREDVVLGQFKFSLTTVAFLPIHLLLANQTKGVEISGQKVWCGSLGVAEYLLGHPDFVQGCSVLELGSGTGLLGMLTKRLGATKVLLTDHDQRSLDHMVLDLEANSVSDTIVERLDWFQLDGVASLVGNFSADSEFRVVAGDVLYKRVLLQPFFLTCQTVMRLGVHLAHPKLILCHVPRAGIEHADVVATAQSFGFVVDELSPELWRKGCVIENCPAEDYDRARVYVMHLEP